MKKRILLLCALMLITIISSSTAFAQDEVDFTNMTPREQYEYLQTLGSQEEIETALATLTEAQRAALTAYEQSLPPVETGEGEAFAPFAEMTVEEQYAYLQTLESDDDIDAALATLTEEQRAAFDAYAQSLAETESKETPPAINYTQAAPFLPPVMITAPMRARSLAVPSMAVVEEDEEDALVLDKTLSGSDGDYLLTIESYATGDVSITTGETPVPADIILVLDVSWSMDFDFFSGYIHVDFGSNSEAYADRENLYVKVDGHYYPVTITRSGSNNKRIYTYSYTISGVTTVYVSGYHTGNDGPPAWDFYHPSTVSRLAALKEAANAFIDSIESKASSTVEGVDHRIAVVTFAYAASIVSGNLSAGGAFVDAYDNETGINSLEATINSLSTSGATRADLGLGEAVNIFQQDTPGIIGPRNRVVVFFTDGAPSANTGNFELPVADAAIGNAHTLKQPVSASGYGATVYTIGIFDGADPTAPIGSASNENKYMHYVSSNYPDATDMAHPGSREHEGYYLSASDTEGLGDIFETISENIETGGTTVTLDDTSVLRDIVTPYFLMDESQIHVYTSTVDETTGAWQPRVPFPAAVTIGADHKTVNVSGFDYSANYYAAIETDGIVTGYRGTKLIVEIPISYLEGSCFGGTIPTNAPPSGIYDDDILVESLPIPTIDIPVNYNFTPCDLPIYITHSVSIADLFTSSVGYVANGTNNAFVDIVYTVEDFVGTVLGTYTIPAGAATGSWAPGSLVIDGLTANTVYAVSCTITPMNSQVLPATIDKQSTVYVWTPRVTFRDSVIYLGETADYDDNLVSVVWINSSSTSPSPAGTAPALVYAYTPVSGALAYDTHVTAAVSIGETDITGHTGFVHETCSFSGCGFDPALGQFMVHVKTCSLTIAKTGAADPTDTFIFEVTGGGMTLLVSVQGDGSATITGLPVGSYTVTEDAAWSWRYTADSETVMLSGANDSGQVSICNQVNNDKWLGGDSWVANLFSTED